MHAGQFEFAAESSGPGAAHLVGICGAGMKALAEVLHDRGWKITGCDADPDPAAARSLSDEGIVVRAGHAATHLDGPPDVLVYSPAIPESHLERRRASELGIPQASYVEMLSRLMRTGTGLAVAGTHGKSTTTAMLGQILETSGSSPTVLCGAESVSRRRSGWAGSGPCVVVEACEYRRHFLDLSPRLVCVTGIEPDHFDCYPTLRDSERAYADLVSKLPDEGSIIFRSDCASTRRIVESSSSLAARVSFSLEDCSADWQAVEVESRSGGMLFRIVNRGLRSRQVQLRVPGRHNVQNALAAAATAGTAGMTLDQITAGLEAFNGLRRRFEILGDWHGGVIIDDYAHHPTEIQAALLTARTVYPGRRVICVFQPHQVSRTAKLLSEFSASLGLADRVYVLPVYAAREAEGTAQVSLSRQLADEVGTKADLIPSLDQVWRTLQTDAGTDAVILTLGAGNLTRIHHEFIGRLP